MSPGARSKALGQVEQVAGIPRFARVGRTSVLTAAGRRFNERAATVSGAYDDLESQVVPEPSRDTPLRIGSFEVFTTHLLAHVLAEDAEPTSVVALELGSTVRIYGQSLRRIRQDASASSIRKSTEFIARSRSGSYLPASFVDMNSTAFRGVIG